MTTLSINIKSAEELGHLDSEYAATSGRPYEALMALVKYLDSLRSGCQSGVVDVHTASADPVAASGTITITHANLADNDTLVVAGQTLTAKSSGANGTTQFNIGADATADATALKNCINANTTLSKYFLATSAAGVVTVTCLIKGAFGNLIGMSSSDNAFAFSGSGYLTSGTGGAEGSPVTYTR